MHCKPREGRLSPIRRGGMGRDEKQRTKVRCSGAISGTKLLLQAESAQFAFHVLHQQDPVDHHRFGAQGLAADALTRSFLTVIEA